MISDNIQIELVGFSAIIGGIYVLIRRKSVAKKTAEDMTRSWWTDRFNYSEEYFQILNIAGGIFFILVGIASLIAAFFRNSENKLPTSLEHLFMGIIGTVFIGGFLLIIFLNIRFRKTK